MHLTSAWGLFSSKAIDTGTKLLLEQIREYPPVNRVLDLGCGYGVIGLVIAARWPEAVVSCVDKDVLAVETTEKNINSNELSNATAVLSPGFRDIPIGPYDLIVSNLPAQAGNGAIDELLLGSFDHLKNDGVLIVVTVAGLRHYIKRRLQSIFGNYNRVKLTERHIVSEARRTTENTFEQTLN